MSNTPAWVHSYLLDPLERASSTFVQQFAVLLLATGSAGLVSYQEWGKAADVAAFAAILSLLTSVLLFRVSKLPPAADLVARVIKTGLQSFAGVLMADSFTHSVVHADWRAALAVAVPTMLLALLKGLAAMSAPWSWGNASLLPAVVVDPETAGATPSLSERNGALSPTTDWNAGYDPVTKESTAIQPLS